MPQGGASVGRQQSQIGAIHHVRFPSTRTTSSRLFTYPPACPVTNGDSVIPRTHAFIELHRSFIARSHGKSDDHYGLDPDNRRRRKELVMQTRVLVEVQGRVKKKIISGQLTDYAKKPLPAQVSIPKCGERKGENYLQASKDLPGPKVRMTRSIEIPMTRKRNVDDNEVAAYQERRAAHSYRRDRAQGAHVTNHNPRGPWFYWGPGAGELKKFLNLERKVPMIGMLDRLCSGSGDLGAGRKLHCDDRWGTGSEAGIRHGRTGISAGGDAGVGKSIELELSDRNDGGVDSEPKREGSSVLTKIWLLDWPAQQSRVGEKRVKDGPKSDGGDKPKRDM
ncbi:hypothetical protein BJV77DRAFT_962893 [Russula vinacea]|nr:hypothetical protein BJV77DRAFT_962893 [Russula vinacea]